MYYIEIMLAWCGVKENVKQTISICIKNVRFNIINKSNKGAINYYNIKEKAKDLRKELNSELGYR